MLLKLSVRVMILNVGRLLADKPNRIRTLPWWYQLATGLSLITTLIFLALVNLTDPGVIPPCSALGDPPVHSTPSVS
jgi:hypothetical protein